MVRRSSEPELMAVEEIAKFLTDQCTKKVLDIRFKDGRLESGYVTYAARKGFGRIIDMPREFSMNFNIHEVSHVQFQEELELEQG
ncbi:MAG: hypothetical protein HN405_08265 [Planctomycetes bacterium]|nr:hypothetical protein [Planctomycetota bacterium]MBT4028946.1 hypothetical protein [Planctomycetota bacterium]MBT4560698.1 hypothetical protein [Planctomycetota bacterium]MBT5101153.1 hypothetical protein [Planctomycetota bacterium]MBT7013198.1 hypothetical protein [Planctomycetota bacterium]